jgi:hypothetical protein
LGSFLNVREVLMPLQLTLTEGVLPKGQEKIAFARLSEAMLRWHGLAGNKAMLPNIIGEVRVLPSHETFSAMQEAPIAIVEWKVPSFAFADRDIQLGYFSEATDIIHELSGGKQPRDRIFINVVHAVDGAWNFNGRAMTNAELGEQVSKG